MENDTPQGGESLSIEQAASAFIKSQAEAVPEKDDQAEAEEQDEGATTDDELQASDEDVSEETDGETGDEDQAEDEPEDEPETERGRYVAHNGRVKLPDGGEATVSALIEGNLKNADATKKWQEAAEIRRNAETESVALKASKQQLDQQRQYMVKLVKSIIPDSPDPAMLDPRSPDYDIVGYWAVEGQRQQWGKHLDFLEAEDQRVQTERNAETEGETKKRLEKEWGQALEKLPELKDPKRLDAFGRDTLKYGAQYGYTPEELAIVHHDHRRLVVLKKAIAWDKLQASKDKVQEKVQGRPPVTRGGKRHNPSEARSRSASDAMNRLKSSGSVEDATAAYLASLNKG